MTHRYRIAVVIPKFGLPGGAEGFTAQLTERLALNRNYEIHVFANQWADTRDNLAYHRIPLITFPKYLTTIGFAFYAGRKIAGIPFDLIHTHDRIFEADLYTMHGVPHRLWVNEVRGKKIRSLFDMGTQWVERKLVTSGRCRYFQAVSSLTKEKFLQEYPDVDPDRVRVIHPGIDTRTFCNVDRKSSRNNIRERFGIESRDKVILFASMNIDIRGLDRLISGLARVRGRHEDNGLKLLVVGKGNIQKYSSLAQNLGIREKVIFAGVTDRKTLYDIYLASDLFSILSEFDTFSMTVLEAMAASLPVMISSNVGAKDLIEEGVNGFVIEDTEDAETVADRIERMLDETVRARMAEAAFRTASTQTWEKATGKVEELYDELLKRKEFGDSLKGFRG